MAIRLPEVTYPPIIVHPEERSAELHIICPIGEDLQIVMVSQMIERDAKDESIVTIGAVETNHPYRLTMSQFIRLCPEMADIPARIGAAMDAAKQKMPKRVYEGIPKPPAQPAEPAPAPIAEEHPTTPIQDA